MDDILAKVKILIKDSEFLNGPYKKAVEASWEGIEFSHDTDIRRDECWNLGFQFGEDDKRSGMDSSWDQYDPRINSKYGYEPRVLMRQHQHLLDSEHIILPGNVVVYKDEDNDIYLLLATWVGFAHTPGTQDRNTFALEGIYLKSTSTELNLPTVRLLEISPLFVDVNTTGIIAFASRAFLDTKEIIELLKTSPAMDQSNRRAVATMVVREKDLQYGKRISFSCRCQLYLNVNVLHFYLQYSNI